MKILYLPLAITLVVLLLMVYVTAALGSAIIGAPLAWLMGASERVIHRLEAWGDRI